MAPSKANPVKTKGHPGKREAILTAALDVFLDCGYAAASVDAIAARAGVSKATIYAHFAGKEALFGTLIADRCDACFGRIEQPALDETGLRAALTKLARDFFDLVTAPEALAMFRVVVAEAARFPEVGRAFYAAGPAPGLEAITRFFAEIDRRGLLDIPDPRLAAEYLVGMLRSDTYLSMLLGLSGPKRPVEAMIDGAVDLIMRGYAPRKPRPGSGAAAS